MFKSSRIITGAIPVCAHQFIEGNLELNNYKINNLLGVKWQKEYTVEEIMGSERYKKWVDKWDGFYERQRIRTRRLHLFVSIIVGSVLFFSFAAIITSLFIPILSIIFGGAAILIGIIGDIFVDKI